MRLRQGDADEHSAIQGCTGEVLVSRSNTRPSPPTDREVPAFAKTDDFMAELTEYQEADDDTNFKVQTLANARLAHKSTIEETRSEHSCQSPRCRGRTGGPCCRCHLRYGGAKTHRLSGDWKMNVQNLVRDTTKSKLRTSATHRTDLSLSRPIYHRSKPGWWRSYAAKRSIGSIQKRR